MAKKGGGSVTQPFQNNSSSTSSSSGTSTSTVNTPDGWLTNWNQMQPGAGGFNPTQQTGVDWMSGQLAGINPNRGATNLNAASNYFQDTLNNRTAPTLANLASSGNSAYAAPASVTAQQIAARRGSEFLNDYQNPYQSQVIDTSLNQYDQDSAEARNSLRANNAGAFGNKRYGVAEGQFAADSALGRAGLGANLRSTGFNTAAGLGMQDANRILSADATNASNRLAADTFNSNLLNSRQQFDANLGMNYNNQRDNVASSLANLGNADYALGQGLAGGLVNAGGMGANQNLNWLNAAVPTFGQTNTQNNTATGTGDQSGYQTGINQAGGKGGTLGGLGSLMQGAGALAAFCWVAREVYGEDNPKWLAFREWMLTRSPGWLRNAYIKYGERIAAWIKGKPILKAMIRAWMDTRIASLKGCV